MDISNDLVVLLQITFLMSASTILNALLLTVVHKLTTAAALNKAFLTLVLEQNLWWGSLPHEGLILRDSLVLAEARINAALLVHFDASELVMDTWVDTTFKVVAFFKSEVAHVLKLGVVTLVELSYFLEFVRMVFYFIVSKFTLAWGYACVWTSVNLIFINLRSWTLIVFLKFVNGIYISWLNKFKMFSLIWLSAVNIDLGQLHLPTLIHETLWQYQVLRLISLPIILLFWVLTVLILRL